MNVNITIANTSYMANAKSLSIKVISIVGPNDCCNLPHKRHERVGSVRVQPEDSGSFRIFWTDKLDMAIFYCIILLSRYRIEVMVYF